MGSASAANQVDYLESSLDYLESSLDYLESFEHLNNRPLTVGLCICGTRQHVLMRTSGWWWTSQQQIPPDLWDMFWVLGSQLSSSGP